MTSIFVDNPLKAHKFYTDILGFQSKEYDPNAQICVVVSPDDPQGVTLLLEPRGNSFAKTYQEKLYTNGLPAIVFGVKDIQMEIKHLKERGVVFRDDLDKPEWGIKNLFEDTVGNLIMLQSWN